MIAAFAPLLFGERESINRVDIGYNKKGIQQFATNKNHIPHLFLFILLYILVDSFTMYFTLPHFVQVFFIHVCFLDTLVNADIRRYITRCLQGNWQRLPWMAACNVSFFLVNVFMHADIILVKIVWQVAKPNEYINSQTFQRENGRKTRLNIKRFGMYIAMSRGKIARRPGRIEGTSTHPASSLETDERENEVVPHRQRSSKEQKIFMLVDIVMVEERTCHYINKSLLVFRYFYELGYK